MNIKICTCIFDTLKVQFAKNVTKLYRLNGLKYCLQNKRLNFGEGEKDKTISKKKWRKKGRGGGMGRKSM